MHFITIVGFNSNGPSDYSFRCRLKFEDLLMDASITDDGIRSMVPPGTIKLDSYFQ